LDKIEDDLRDFRCPNPKFIFGNTLVYFEYLYWWLNWNTILSGKFANLSHVYKCTEWCLYWYRVMHHQVSNPDPLCSLLSDCSSGLGGAGCASSPQNVLIFQKFGQNLKQFEQRHFDIFNNINVSVFPCY